MKKKEYVSMQITIFKIVEDICTASTGEVIGDKYFDNELPLVPFYGSFGS